VSFMRVDHLGRKSVAPFRAKVDKNRGLTAGWYCNTICAGSETARAAQAKDRNVKEATIVGSHHPPAVTVRAGVFV